jgi:hypothetical protein
MPRLRLLTAITALRDKYKRVRTSENHSPYNSIYLWLTRVPSVRGVAVRPMTKGLSTKTQEIGFDEHTYHKYVAIADDTNGHVRVEGAPPRGIASCYSKLDPQWSLTVSRGYFTDDRRMCGLSIYLRNLVQESWFGLYSQLFDLWELSGQVRLRKQEGGFRITVPEGDDWLLQTPHRVNGTPAWTEIYHWPEIEKPARMLQDAVQHFFPSVTYQSLGLGAPIKDLENIRPRLNAFATSWVSRTDIGYKTGFDPFVRPDWATDDDPVRCPVLFWYDRTPEQDTVPVLQVDVIHTSRGSFLELQSIRGRKKMNEFIKVAGIPFEFWEGPPHLRWDGKGTAVAVV